MKFCAIFISQIQQFERIISVRDKSGTTPSPRTCTLAGPFLSIERQYRADQIRTISFDETAQTEMKGTVIERI